MLSRSSWHPASMPNSAADIIPTKSSDNFGQEAAAAIQSLEPTPEPVLSAPSSDMHLSAVAAHNQGDDIAGQEIPEENTGHTELTDLRNDLATSLASPGGVQLDQNPLHSGISDDDGIDHEKADFPSKGPTPPNKHLSTVSFARTVSEEVNWGEDDDVDPEWNIQRSDSDPFKLMAKSDRTNSFPQVPPAHTLPTNFEPLYSQAEDIMHEVEHVPKDLFGDEDNDGEVDFFTQQPSRFDDPSTLQPVALEDANPREQDEPDYGQPYGGGDFQVEEEQSRNEEGLPLIPSSENKNTETTKQPLFLDGVAEEEDDFFAQVRRNDATEDALPASALGRKSTFQVMDSLHFQPYEQTRDDIPGEENMESSQSSLERSTGGGIAVSASTVLSQVLGDPEAPIHNEPANLAALELNSGEGDLAEKWKAALAGDEFLDDEDDFLPDDEPSAMDSAAMDPSTLFGSDDEGFLEDTDEPDVSAEPSSLIRPPLPAPVTTPNGHMVGFDSVTGSAYIKRATSSSSSRYHPSGATTTVAPPNNSYAPSAPLLTDLSRPATTSALPSYAAPATGSYPILQQQQQQQCQLGLVKAQSFADKSKGGYSSPYDLPMEVVKPRKRVSMQQMTRGYNTATAPANAPPPRSSSVHSQPPPPSRGSTSSLSPPTSSHSFQQSQFHTGAANNATQPPKTDRKTTNGFFEDLPVSSRPKPAPRHPSSLNSPGQSPYSPQIPPNPEFSGPPAHTPYTSPVQQQPFQPPGGQDLVPPERVSPYASLPAKNIPVPLPAVSARYSPVPPPQQSQAAVLPPISQSRYSPAPPNSRPHITSYASAPANAAQPPSILAHQPRTSSPLAHFEKSHVPSSYAPQIETTSYDRRSSSSAYESTLRPSHLPPTREVDEVDVPPNAPRSSEVQKQSSSPSAAYTPPGVQPASRTPPPPQDLATRIGNSPPKRTTSNYLPQQPSASGQPSFMPPQRSQTQSPGALYAGSKLEINTPILYQRPASVEVPPSPRTNPGNVTISPSASRPRGFSQGLNYIAPTDGRENDPMQRWRGAPIFAWGVGGTIVTSFPTDVPRYGMNQTAPMILRSPGVVKIRNIKDTDPLQERLTSFPGPLKGKSKKKEVISWLTSGIDMLENSGAYLKSLSSLSHDDKRTEERILLWKILRVFIENDGTLEGTPVVEKAVRTVLSPGIDDDDTGATLLYATGAELSGISHSSVSTSRPDPVEPAAVDQLRKYLLRGQREEAVWEAVDKRLWAHALLISNTVSKDLYKQVAQEFVQKEVKNIGDNTESLAALYEIFAGNFEESIDELVPPSARAGFQMISTTNSGPSKDALDGLDRWRETLGLVLSNRSNDDSQALNALGKLLSGYGRAEAAHICFLFARTYSVFGGIDDPQASIVLVGSDHLRQPYDFDKEMEPILLSEVFEYGVSLSSVSNMTSASPHLSVYKMQHAVILAEYGYREKALQYCEAIAASITSQTRRSPYHHALLVSALDDLSKRLKQSPKDESSSWISKPSIDKVSGSVWATFNKFVAGDENDSAGPSSATGSATEVGPFARIASGTPSISRSPSNSDLYGSYNNGISINGALAATKASSRYAPGAAYTPLSHEPQLGTSYGSQSRGSFEERSSSELRRGQYEPQRQMSDYRPNSQPSTNNFTLQSDSSYTPQSSYTPYGNDSPYVENSSPYTPQQSTPLTEQPSNALYSLPQPVNNFDGQQPVSSYIPHEASYGPQSSRYEPPSSGGYGPPTSSGYEPPSYVPSSMNEEPDSPISTRPKKKSFIDDDDDDIGNEMRVPKDSNPVEKTKAEKDREVDEAFRKAAEADAAKGPAAQPAKKGWGLGGWFGGGAKKEADISQPNKPIRAKLGEASSFVYDPELKRWVNKKAGADNTPTPSATPPPPKAGPTRTVSGPPGASFTSAPPLGSGPPQRAVSRSSDMDGTPQEISGSAPPPLGAGGLGAPPGMSRSASNGSTGPPTGPPSRPGTSMSNASSIDDLLGPPTVGGRKGTARRGKKGRGYVDVMGDKAAGAS